MNMEKGKKVRVYPLQMRRSEDFLSGNWISKPENVKEHLKLQLEIDRPTWEVKKIWLDPGIRNMALSWKSNNTN